MAELSWPRIARALAEQKKAYGVRTQRPDAGMKSGNPKVPKRNGARAISLAKGIKRASPQERGKGDGLDIVVIRGARMG